MGNKIAVWFSGVRLIDIGNLTLDNVINEDTDLTKFLDMLYCYESKQVDLIVDMNNRKEDS